MKKGAIISILFVVCGLLASCASMGLGGPDRSELQGRWLYVCPLDKDVVVNGAEPPQFDIIEFDQSGKLLQRSTMARIEQQGTYSVQGEQVLLKYKSSGAGPDAGEPVRFKKTPQGNELLRPGKNTTAQYINQDRLLKTEIAGTWRVKKADEETMVLGTDGSFELLKSKLQGFYRVWESEFGKTFTMCFLVNGAVPVTRIFSCDLQGSSLRLVPINGKALLTDEAFVWERTK